MDFYSRWCGLWEEAESERRHSRTSIQPEELEWVDTPYDSRAALLVSRETGFRTWGTSSYIAEIPTGWSTGKHRHGEECIHILAGEGVSVVDGVAYPWTAGSTLALPFASTHQHFNTGGETARYVSLQTVDLEHFAGVHRTTHVEDRGAFDTLPDVPVQADGLSPSGTRVALTLDEAVRRTLANAAERSNDADAARTRERLASADGGSIEMGDTGAMLRSLELQHDQVVHIMKIDQTMNDFAVQHVEMSAINSDPPKAAGGKHAHMEAMLYILDGEGYTVIDDVEVPWGPGSALYITGPQTVHQHFVTGDVPSRMLRMASGFRYFMEAAAKAEFPYLFFEERGPLDP